MDTAAAAAGAIVAAAGVILDAPAAVIGGLIYLAGAAIAAIWNAL